MNEWIDEWKLVSRKKVAVASALQKRCLTEYEQHIPWNVLICRKEISEEGTKFTKSFLSPMKKTKRDNAKFVKGILSSSPNANPFLISV